MFKHALAMSYDATSFYLYGAMPAQYAGLKRIMNFNAGNAPLSLSFSGSSMVGKYSFAFSDKAGKSTLDSSKTAGKSFNLDNDAVAFFKGYSCAQTSDYGNFSSGTSYSDVKRMYQTNFATGSDFAPVANFQSRYVVAQMVEQTIASLKTGFYDQMFLDEVGRVQPDCVNKEYGGWGTFSTWKEGQLSFIKQVTDAAHNMNGRLGSPIKVTANVWSPYERATLPQNYASGEIRFDHYYFEAGGFAIQDAENGLVTNGTDPETGLPAYLNPIDGYLPANRVSVETKYTFHGDPNDVGTIGETFMMQHYNAAGVAANQGSWFGWYGESQVDLRNKYGNLVHTNAMMLLRAIPNWENIASVPLSSRSYDKASYHYQSPNSEITTSLIQGWNPVNKTLYVVPMDTTGTIDLKDGVIKTAYFVDELFNATSENAMPCLSGNNGKVKFTCGNKVRTGIRINF